jgi:Flp pilus assembly protein TadG
VNVSSLGCSTTGIYLGVRPELTDHPGPKSLSRRLRHCKLAAARTWKFAMKALLLYVLFVVVGATIAVGIGYVVEMQVSSTVSLIVFLAFAAQAERARRHASPSGHQPISRRQVTV